MRYQFDSDAIDGQPDESKVLAEEIGVPVSVVEDAARAVASTLTAWLGDNVMGFDLDDMAAALEHHRKQYNQMGVSALTQMHVFAPMMADMLRSEK